MMLTDGHYLMLAYAGDMNRDTVRAVAHFDIATVFANPDFLACVLPGYRIAAALPRDIRIPCDFAQLIVHVRIVRTAVHHLHGELILVKPPQHFRAGRAMHALVGNLGDPSAQLGIEVGQIAWFSPQQSAQKISPDVFHARLSIFPFVCAR